MNKPRLLDTFCKAGGAGMGYYRAGFDVVGVDIEPQPHYPFPFIQADALEVLAGGFYWKATDGNEYGLNDFAAFHASPPCQGYSRMRFLPWLAGRKYALLIDPVRTLLKKTGKPWIIENVVGAPLDGPEVCGLALGLRLIRHRKFECSFFILVPPCPGHPVIFSGNKTMGKRGQGSGVMGVIDGDAKTALGIDWMTNMEMRQAVPPAYTEFIGRYLLEHVL